MSEWYDEVDHSPDLICEIELSNGERMQARNVCGGWETLDGEAVYPVRWRFLRVGVRTALYPPPDAYRD